MTESILNAELRTDNRKGAARKLRREHKIPCVIYGQDETISLSVEKRELEKVLGEHHSVISIKTGSKKEDVVIKEIQYHPVQGNVLHIDFMRLKAGQKITVEIPVKFIGEAPGVRDEGGVFQAIRNELKVTTFPRHLMDAIEIDISKMEVGDAVHVGDLNIENFEFHDEPEVTLCSIVYAKTVLPEEEEAAEEEIGEEEEMAEPEVITSKKSDEEEEEKE